MSGLWLPKVPLGFKYKYEDFESRRWGPDLLQLLKLRVVKGHRKELPGPWRFSAGDRVMPTASNEESGWGK